MKGFKFHLRYWDDFKRILPSNDFVLFTENDAKLYKIFSLLFTKKFFLIVTLVGANGARRMCKASTNQMKKKISSKYSAPNGRLQLQCVNNLMKCMFMYNLGEASMLSCMLVVIPGA